MIAFAMYYFTYDPWIGKLLYLEDFFVMQEFRGKKCVMSCYMVMVKVNKLQRNGFASLRAIHICSFVI